MQVSCRHIPQAELHLLGEDAKLGPFTDVGDKFYCSGYRLGHESPRSVYRGLSRLHVQLGKIVARSMQTYTC